MHYLVYILFLGHWILTFAPEVNPNSKVTKSHWLSITVKKTQEL